MGFLLVYAKLYANCFQKALSGIGKNAWTLALPVGLSVAFSIIAVPIASLGIVGGFILGLLMNLALSCYLYFTAGTVAQQKMNITELKKSFLVYFWSVMGLFFVIWIAELLLGFVLAANPNRGVILSALTLISLIVLNPAPEVIYLKGTRGGMDTITRCVRFIQDNWIEWFIPNGLLLAGAYLLVTRVIPLLPTWGWLVIALVAGALLHVVMVFRGHLFEALDSSTHRQRMYRYRAPVQ